eukprot:CAMPEP_0179342130 /NCGR_PEP_ID=MMETSP0797-20121207/70234_1 /TAXON_ID=47934 /ORGANISM="Dinophysis acuminata, Strain DAEP01" /LENGTH=93 /DNA_ID=CAMNT_0021056307 /DNA_START=122 /DNA_END=399 /DNA_ORIENTATION=+
MIAELTSSHPEAIDDMLGSISIQVPATCLDLCAAAEGAVQNVLKVRIPEKAGLACLDPACAKTEDVTDSTLRVGDFFEPEGAWGDRVIFTASG